MSVPVSQLLSHVDPGQIDPARVQLFLDGARVHLSLQVSAESDCERQRDVPCCEGLRNEALQSRYCSERQVLIQRKGSRHLAALSDASIDLALVSPKFLIQFSDGAVYVGSETSENLELSVQAESVFGGPV